MDPPFPASLALLAHESDTSAAGTVLPKEHDDAMPNPSDSEDESSAAALTHGGSTYYFRVRFLKTGRCL